ncbi:MAG TPA: BolA/IbaG family iron-sulfur metabolism protein [Candidatus Megaira endosymbiont of Nemacystus decipiens]|nr:BolA/IbaG family iron-sulfur metabolism protein [Candidatus Megaera endosymbiont of Nemacystus decipiens]
MSRKERIKKKLAVLNPHFLEILDQSALHIGHAGVDNNQTETHFLIKLSASTLDGKTKIQKHRMINELLKEEFSSGLHALSIKFI